MKVSLYRATNLTIEQLKEVTDAARYYATNDGINDIRADGGRLTAYVRGNSINFNIVATEFKVIVYLNKEAAGSV